MRNNLSSGISSGIRKQFNFSESQVLMHLVCFMEKGNIFKQHAQVLVERIVGGEIHLSSYDMFALLSKKHDMFEAPGKIINIREMLRVAPLSDEVAISELYNDPRFKPDFFSTYVVPLENFNKAKDWFAIDQVNTALGIAESFVEASKNNSETTYFLSQDKLPNLGRFGVSSVSRFIDMCSQLVRDMQSEDPAKPSRAALFLKTVNNTEFKDFLKQNLEKMNKDRYLSGRLKNYSMVGAGFLLDSRPRSERKPKEPINCTRWAKDFLEAANVSVKNKSDVPKKAAEHAECSIM